MSKLFTETQCLAIVAAALGRHRPLFDDMSGPAPVAPVPVCGPSDVNVPAPSGDPVGAGPGVHTLTSTTLDTSLASASVMVASARCAAAFDLGAMWAKAKAGARREALFWGFTSVQAEAGKSVAFCRDLGLLLHVGCVK